MGIPLENTKPVIKDANMNIKQPTDADNNETTVKKKDNKISKLEAAIHLFKGNVGAGLFAMGDCFKNGGLIGASVFLPILAVICVHCEQMLIHGSIMALERTTGATFFDYPETVQMCFQYGPLPLRRISRLMKLLVEMFLCITQFGFCSIYFVFITENLHQVFLSYNWNVSPSLTMLITLIPVMIPSLMTNLKYISPVSACANFALLFGLIATLAVAFIDGPMPSVTERHFITNGTQLSLFFGTALFSYEGIALILPLRNSLREPETFSTRFGVLNVTMTIITFLFIFTGFVGYLKWGEAVEGSITLNLNADSIMSQIIKIVAALGVFFGYPIQFYVMIKIIWQPLKQNSVYARKYPITVQVLLRFFMILMTFGVALMVPRLHLFISLIGALCSTALAFVIPVLLDFVVKAQTPKSLTMWIYIKNMCILLLGVVGIVTGSYESLVEIYKAFHL